MSSDYDKAIHNMMVDEKERLRASLATVTAERDRLREALAWIGEHCDAENQGLALAEIQHFTVVALSSLSPSPATGSLSPGLKDDGS